MAKSEKDVAPVAVVYKAGSADGAPRAEKKYVSPNAPPPVGMDFTESFPMVGAAVGIDDLTKIAQVYRDNKGMFDAIFSFFKSLVGKKKSAPGAPVVVTPAPVVVLPPPAGPIPSGRVVASLNVKWYFFEIPKNTDHPQDGDIPNKAMRVATKDEFDDFVSGVNAIPRRSRLHVDITPVDQFGKDFLPGDEANKLLLRPDGYPAFEHILGGPVQLTNEYDDFGCTPVLKIPKDTNLPARAAITYQVRLGDIVSRVLGPVFTD